MTGNITSKAMALAGISALLAGSIAVLNTVSQGVLFETKKAGAAEKTAVAANIEAENTLKAAIEQAKGIIEAAQKAAKATTDAANVQAQGLIAATAVSMHPENGMYEGVTNPMLTEPMKNIAKLNKELSQVNWEVQRGLDLKTRRALSDSELAERANRKMILDEELSVIQDSTSKSWSDTMNIVWKSVGQGLVGGQHYATPGVESTPGAPTRRIIRMEP